MQPGNMEEHEQFSETDRDNDEDYLDNDEENDHPENGKHDDDDDEEEEFKLDDVLRLGGTKGDYVLLAGIADSNEILNGGKKTAIDDLEEGELEEFIKKLGIRTYAGQQIIQSEDGENETSPEPSKKAKKKAKTAKMKAESKTDVKPAAKKLSSVQSTDSGRATGKKAKQKNTNLFEFHPRQTLLIKPGGKWFDKEYVSEITSGDQSVDLVSQYKALAKKLFEAEVALYKSKKNLQKGANSTWMKSVVSTGTLADRMAAMTVLIQDAPVHTLEHVESLVAQVKKTGGRRQCLMALDTLKELLLSDLLPEHRKLFTFSQRPFDNLEEKASGNKDTRDRRLILWYFEHLLKLHIAEFVIALDILAHDTVNATKMRALITAFELLCDRQEQEKALLAQIVNKLGDPDYKMASKAVYLLEMVLHKHPNMKGVVCLEVERIMFRSNIHPKAQYYGTCFLNQVVLSHNEAELSTKLITIYFAFFYTCIAKKGVESKMLSALLSGVNRAYPYANIGDDKVAEQVDTLFKVVQSVKFNTAVQALMLLFQVMDSQQTISDRYYVSLYRKLLDPGLASSSRQSMFLNLLYKSLKADISLRRVKAFVKRFLQVSCTAGPAFTCGVLFLVSELMKANPGLRLMLQQEEDEDEETFHDIKEDIDDDAEQEHADKEEETKGEEINNEKQCQVKLAATWVHYKNMSGSRNSETYDPFHRNPKYCRADRTVLWELQKLSLHFHPSVIFFAKTLLQGEFIQYTGNPLQDFTLVRFLDRFVFRNPKQSKGKQNTDSTLMQPKCKRTFKSVPSEPGKFSIGTPEERCASVEPCVTAVNSEEYLSKEESQIPVDEKRETDKRFKKRSRAEDNESVEDVDDNEFERVLDTYEGDSFYTDFKDDDLDFAGNMKSKSKKDKDADSDLDMSSDGDLDDEEVSLGSMEDEFGDYIEEEGGEFMDPDDEVGDEEEFEDLPSLKSTTKKGKRTPAEQLDFRSSGTHPKKKRKTQDRGVFTTAEEFGCLLDENTSIKFDNCGIDAMANTDKADVRQLKWEARRNDWIHGKDVKTLRKKKAMFNKKKFGVARKQKTLKRQK
ncbi:CCAAT/enhancer-binding protein zeta CCAAT-box-binding transcription factor [Triplophysa tibetana]|uniref:CCAAT/enhancer-binding protein zeta n=1 Tax=Triplophysa tibetana TaxID=1572043 RepID=A0A5A9NHU0_9TELE|nr:CCAAT/enhancer-binding protein zeta CCAAT-box-binding transcription factor [Triplophysa tibetana]